jgi:hypothetical protein
MANQGTATPATCGTRRCALTPTPAPTTARSMESTTMTGPAPMESPLPEIRYKFNLFSVKRKDIQKT